MELQIPNQNFSTKEAESYTAEETSRRSAVVVGVAYHHEPSQMIAVLEEVARQHEQVLQYPPISSRPRQTAIQETTQLASRRR